VTSVSSTSITLTPTCSDLILGAVCPATTSVTLNETLVPIFTGGGTVTQTVTIGASTVTVSGTIPPFTFNLPVAINITCPSALNPNLFGTAIPFQTPGPIGNIASVVAVGILPRALICQAIPVDAAGNTSVAPGTIEVTSLQGGLIDASGRLTTNLRIPCENGVTTFTPILGSGQVLATNSCQGVQFGVLGSGVGFVELRARYEPRFPACNGFTVPCGTATEIQEVEGSATVAFIAPITNITLSLNPNPVTVGATGTATASFNVGTALCGVGIFCVDPNTGAPISVTAGSVLNGTVVFTIDNTAIASWTGAQPTATAGAPSSTTGFTTTANQTATRCGIFGVSTAGPLGTFFGGCASASAQYRGNVPGVTGVTATFIADLPGSFGQSTVSTLAPNVTALLGLFGPGFNAVSSRALEVIGAAPSGVVQLARGCNNVSPTVTEDSAKYAARVTPSSALVAIWEHQAATNTFKGWSPQTGAPNDLAGVTRLRPVFVCVSAAATLDQPPA
jgi:hypothetical protein